MALAACIGLFVAAAPPSSAMAQDGPAIQEGPASLASPSQAGWQTTPSPHFAVSFQANGAPWSAPVAEAAESAFVAYARLFDDAPETPITLRLYGDVQALLAANPLAADYGDGLAYARRRTHSIDLAVPIGQPGNDPDLASEVRYELAHLFVLQSTDGALAPLWQEGVSRFVAADAATATSVARLRDAATRGTLYRWPELAATGAEYLDPRIAYAESQAIVHWLVGTRGLTPLFRFLKASAESPSWSEAMRSAYGTDASTLEAAWRGQLATYLNGTWQHPAVALDAATVARLVASGDYREAALRVALAGVDPSSRGTSDAAELQRLLGAAEVGAAGREALRRAADALDAGDYAAAAAAARSVAQSAEGVPAADLALAGEIRDRAERGQRALSQLAVASRRPAWQLFLSRQEAFDAAVSLAALGNDAAAEEARRRVTSLDRVQSPLGWALVLAGAAVLTVNVWRRRKDARRGFRPA